MIKVGVVGGTGYTGVELLRLLAQHPQVEHKSRDIAVGCGNARRTNVPKFERIHKLSVH